LELRNAIVFIVFIVFIMFIVYIVFIVFIFFIADVRLHQPWLQSEPVTQVNKYFIMCVI